MVIILKICFIHVLLNYHFFSQLDIEDKPKFIQELIKNNKNRNSSSLLDDFGQMDAKSNLGLKQNGKNKKNLEEKIIEEKIKKKCYC